MLEFGEAVCDHQGNLATKTVLDTEVENEPWEGNKLYSHWKRNKRTNLETEKNLPVQNLIKIRQVF